jgi:hypothetical protein
MFIPREDITRHLQDDGRDWQPAAAALHQERDWLDQAFEFDSYNSKSLELRALVNEIYNDIAPHLTVRKHKSRVKQTLKTVLINLWLTGALEKPVYYSRNKNSYRWYDKFGRQFITYALLMPVIDALDERGYIEQAPGYQIRDEDTQEVIDSRQTRMWASPKLLTLFAEHWLYSSRFFNKPTNLKALILLKDDEKNLLTFEDTKETRRIRKNLMVYNEAMKRVIVHARLDGTVEITNRHLLYFINIHRRTTIQLTSVLYIQPISIPLPTRTQIVSNLLSKPVSRHLPILSKYSSPITMTKSDRFRYSPVSGSNQSDISLFEAFLNDLKNEVNRMDEEEKDAFLRKPFTLADINIKNLEFIFWNKHLHRVFNLGSFEKGGRSYGATHQGMPKTLRKYILIDGEPTVEVDYSGFHIRMLYHRDGIDYRDDPYIMPGEEAFRKAYKSVALVAINADGPREAVGAIREAHQEHGFALPQVEHPFKHMLETFKRVHQRIDGYLYTSVGLDLQYLDSRIMDAILMRLLAHGIIGLPVHDSVIVQRKHKDLLQQIMTEEYEKVMGFKPRF